MSASEPVRVLHLIKGLGPGGAERLLVSFAEVADPAVATHEVAYLLPVKQHLVPELDRLGVRTHLLAGSRGLGDPRWPLRLRRLARGFDVVHLHSPAVAAMARPLLRTLRRAPALVSTEHNVWSGHSWPTRLANAVTLPFDHERLAVSQQVVDSSWRPWRAKTRVLVHGIPAARLRVDPAERTAARREQGWREDDVVVVVVANLRAQKDYPTLFRAAAAAIAAEPRLRFVSIGQGPLEAALRAELARHGLGERFVMLGYHPDPRSVLAGADVFTLTSRDEGLSIALLEAMASGLPPVVTAVGGIPTVVTHERDALVVAPGAPQQLADAYVRLAREPELRTTLSQRAHRRAEDFDIARAARELEATYLRAGRRRSGDPER